MPYRFELATAADDADLRQILAATPMDGTVALTFRREPSFFAAGEVEGRPRQVVAAREVDAGRLVGFGCRSIRRVFINGTPTAAGYLSSLRLLAEHRNRGLIARGYAFFRELHGDGQAPIYFTTIADGNEVSLRLLTSGRAGLPRYHFAGEYHTAAVPLGARGPDRRCADIRVRPATLGDRPELLRFLADVGPRRQFFPCLDANDLFGEGGVFQGLAPDDLSLAFRAGELVGTFGAWNQSAFRQTIVHGYARRMRWLRPLYNGWARWRRRPTLPSPGQPLHYRTGALPVVRADDPEVFAELIRVQCSRSRAEGFLLIGLHAADPLLPVLRQFATAWYTTRLYLVAWEDGEAMRQSLDGRVPYLELGTL